MNKRVRAVASLDNNIGIDRQDLFSKVIDRINDSINNGYFLEAIALLESLIADRLESRLSFLLSKNVGIGFVPISRLIKDINDKEEQDKIISISNEVGLWAKDRNKCIHQIAKIDINSNQSWGQQMEFCKSTADKGLILFRKVDKDIRLPK